MPDINRAYQWCIQTCNAPNVGYSQGNRNQKTVNGITYYDCSSLMWYALKTGGFDVETAFRSATGYSYSGNAITTANERTWLVALGFTQVPITGEWKAGDILWRSGHTEMVYTGGQASGVTMGAHQPNVPLVDQVSINDYTSTANSWTELYRYGSGGAVSGISIYVISAICGNFWVESNINPALWETPSQGTGSYTDLGRGYGLGQWTNTGGDTHGRLYQLYEWMTANGYAMNDGYGQLQYILEEDVWYQNSSYPEFTNLTSFLQSTSTDLERLVGAWCRCWEGISGDLELRYQNAQIVFNYLRQHANDISITTWVVGNRYLTQSEILNNAVLLYRFLSAGGGGGGTISRQQMPVWMMLRPWWFR